MHVDVYTNGLPLDSVLKWLEENLKPKDFQISEYSHMNSFKATITFKKETDRNLFMVIFNDKTRIYGRLCNWDKHGDISKKKKI